MTVRMAACSGALAMMIALVPLARPAAGQQMTAPPNALQGFSVNRDKPIRITSATLEVRDKEKKATFIGNVLVAQGDTTMKSKTLDVYYDQDESSGDAKPAQPMPTEQGQIRRLEAKGGVIVTQKEQTATGDTGIFDMPTNTVTLVGNVVITQGQDVLRGDKLIVDLTSGVSQVEGGQKGVQALFHPRRGADSRKAEAKSEDGKSADGKATETKSADSKEPGRGKEGSKSSGKSSPGQPLKLN